MNTIAASRLDFPPGVSKVSDEISGTFNVKRDNAIIHNTDPTNTINLHPVGNQVYTVRGVHA